MADLNQLRKPAASRKGEPPAPVSNAGNLSRVAASGANVPLQLKVSPEVRRDFHSYAIARDLHANALFQEVWNFYKANHG